MGWGAHCWGSGRRSPLRPVGRVRGGRRGAPSPRSSGLRVREPGAVPMWFLLPRHWLLPDPGKVREEAPGRLRALSAGSPTPAPRPGPSWVVLREEAAKIWPGSGARAPGLTWPCFQISTSQIKVDKVQIIGSNSCPFAVCLDQDERKILQSVIR